jgi:quercetin dioxygenase-like cupin family protein
MSVTDDEPEVGDPPCWAHLFDEAAGAGAGAEQDGEEASPAAGSSAAHAAVVNLALLARSGIAQGTAWTHRGEDLNANLLVFAIGRGVAGHVNSEADVLLVGIAGEGVVEVDGTPRRLGAGQALVVPKGARRATRALSDRFAYLTCHRRRGGLWPSS